MAEIPTPRTPTPETPAEERQSVLEGLRDPRAGRETLLAFYDGCEPVAVDALLGLWRGGAWASGTRFDGVLERLNWYGKLFRRPDDVQALLFQRPATILGWINHALIWPFRLPEHPGLVLHPLGRARLRTLQFRGKVSASMVYDYLPIIDHFRRVDEATLIGLMDLRGRRDSELFFWLERVVSPGEAHE